MHVDCEYAADTQEAFVGLHGANTSEVYAAGSGLVAVDTQVTPATESGLYEKYTPGRNDLGFPVETAHWGIRQIVMAPVTVPAVEEVVVGQESPAADDLAGTAVSIH